MIDTGRLRALTDIVGGAGILHAPADLSAYELDAREGRGRAAFVIRPRDTYQVSQVVAYCVQAGLPLIAQGANSGLVGASTPDQTGTQGVLSFELLRDAIEIDVENRTVCVSAGVRLSTLNERLEPHGLFLPIDLGADPSIGGMVATNTGGSRFVRYGDVRKHVLGVEVVLPNASGTVVDLLSKLRKNNVGLDAKQAFIGTGCTNGFITKAVLEVHPIPRQRATAILVPRDDAAVMELLRGFEERCGNELAAFEGMSRNAVLRALGHVPSVRNPFGDKEIPEFSILVELSRSWAPRDGEQSVEDVLTMVLEQLWGLDSAPLADAYVGSSEHFWSLRHALNEGLRSSGRVFAFDVSFARTDVMPFRRAMAPEITERFPGLEICDFGHVADGGVHYNLVEPRDSASKIGADDVAELRHRIFERVVHEFAGSFSAEHGIGRSNAALYDRYVHPEARRMASVIGEALRVDAKPASVPLRRVGAE